MSGSRTGSAGRPDAPRASGRRRDRRVSTGRCSDGLSARACHVPPVHEKWLLRSWRDAAKTRVVVSGVVARPGCLRLGTAADDAPSAAIARARGGHGVFAVVAAPLGRKQALAVGEDDAIFRKGERPTSVDRTL